MRRFVQFLPVILVFLIAFSISACSGGSTAGGGTSQNPTTPTVTVTPASSSINTTQSLVVTVAVSGTSGSATGSVVLSSGSYTSSAATLSSGSASITIPAGSLSAGTDTLTARYTPDSGSSATYYSASGIASVTVTQSATTPTVTVTPASSSVSTTQSLGVTVAVTGTGGTATGSVVLSSGSYTSSAATLSSGSASITIPAGSLSAGTDTLTARYTPDSGSSATYYSASGIASVTVTQSATTPTVTVTPASSSVSTTQSLGVTVAVTGTGGTATGSVVLSSGSYTSSAATLSSGSASITIPAGSLSAGTDTLTARYTPDTAGSTIYNIASGIASVTVTQSVTTPTVTVTPASSSVSTTQSLGVTVAVTGTGGTATGSVVLSSGSYASTATTLSSGSTSITIPAGSLSAGTDTLTARYTPDSGSSATYNSASGIASVTVTQPATTPTVTVTPASSSVSTTQSLGVTVAVTGTGGTATGSVVLSSGSYASTATTLSSGSASITIPAGSLATGTDTLTAQYTPDTAGSTIYNIASGIASVQVNAGNVSSVSVNINTLGNRHAISPFIYGGNGITSTSQLTDSGLSLVRWGGNASSDYNWQLHTYNSGADYYFEDFTMGGAEPDSVQFLTDVESTGAYALTTMPMMSWVAQSAENGSNGHWSFPVSTYGTQCKVDPYNTSAGDGLKADCSTPVTTSAVTSAYFPLLDSTSVSCPTGNCVYRQPWAQALATAFGSKTCSVPYSTITSCHFYDMDNEPEIWSGSHMDIHPIASGYNELANDFEAEGSALKTWDPAAVRFGPVTCCWWYYWNVGPATDNKATNGGVDLLPWWLNQIYWLDQINGSRTLDVFDVHAYPDASTSGLTTAQTQALAADVYRDYWDPTYVSTSGTVNQAYATSMQPNKTIPFRIPRFKAMVNAIYPGTPLSFTEWSAAFVSESDFSTALGDADALGVMGREGLTFATRWGAAVSPNPNYQAFKLYTNYDGAHSKFGAVSVSDTNNGNVNLFSSYAALNATGTVMTVMVLNKDPQNSAQVTFNLTGFDASTYVAYTLSSSASSAIAASSTTAWNASQSFAPYSITLLVISGTEVSTPVSEWSLNPDDLMIPASGTAALHPAISSGSATVTLTSAVFDAFEGAAACSGSLVLTNATVLASQTGTITVHAGSTPGFCHYTVTGSDGTATQTQGGWIVVGNPAATLAQTGNNQSGNAGTALTLPLTVTLTPGQSGGTATGAGILFTTSAGTLSNGTTTGNSLIATTNSSGIASVTLTLPSTSGTVTVTAQDMFAVGGATVTFTETAK